jgi:hypothetical protein
MTINNYGYLTTSYLSGPYLGGYVGNGLGAQVTNKVYDQLNIGSQSNQSIYDTLDLGQSISQKIYKTVINGQQVMMFINRNDDSEIVGSEVEIKIYSDLFVSGQVSQKIYSSLPLGSQVELIKSAVLEMMGSQINLQSFEGEIIGQEVKAKIYDLLSEGFQVDQKIYDTKTTGSQVDQKIIDASSNGLSVKFAPLLHCVYERYLTRGYLTDAYLAAGFNTYQGMQVEQKLYHPNNCGSQVFQNVYETNFLGNQVDQKINDDRTIGNQVDQKLFQFSETGSQVDQFITEALSLGHQVELKIFDDNKIGCQVTIIKSVLKGSQVRMVIYNRTQLRILQNFVSRGTPSQGGNNWTSNTTLKTGDFGTANINTDVLEQRCETSFVPSLWTLDCDTGISQGAFVDTLAILQHNFSKSAQVIFQGSTVQNFSTIGFSVTLNSELINTYYIAPELPNQGFRYWRLLITDNTNTASSLYVGAIIFGTSSIMSVAETFENPISYGTTHYKDSVETEGYRNVSNDRALRKRLSLSFSQLRYDSGNFGMLRDYWLNAQTDIACLIIPRPTKPSAFAVFSKLTQLPAEEHNAISDYDHYVSFSLDWDESL